MRMSVLNMWLQTIKKITRTHASQGFAWHLAVLATLVLPWMLIVDRTGTEICSALIGLTFLWHSARTRNWAWARDGFSLLCFAAWAWLLLVVTPLANDPSESLSVAVVWMRVPLMFIALRYWVLAHPAALKWTIINLSVLLGLVVIDTLWQYSTGLSLTGHGIADDNRLTGPMDGPKVGLFIGKLVIPTATMGAFVLCARRRRAWLGWLALLLAVVATIMLAGERSAFLAAMLAIACAMGLLVLVERQFRVACIAMGVAALVVSAGVYATNDFVRERAKLASRTILHYSKSDYGQLAKAGYDIGVNNLLHGVGLKGFRDLCPEMDHYGIPFRGMHPHNVYIEWFAEAGLPGLLFCVAIVTALLVIALRTFRSQKGYGRILPAIAFGAVLQHYFPLMGMQSFFTNWSAILVWYALGLMFSTIPPRHGATVH